MAPYHCMAWRKGGSKMFYNGNPTEMMKTFQAIGLSTVKGAIRGCGLLLFLFLFLRLFDAMMYWNELVRRQGEPIPQRSSIVVCPPGEKVEVVQENEVIWPRSDQTWRLSSVVAPDWIDAEGWMYYYVWQGGTGPHGQVDFRGTIEVSKDAPREGEAQVVFTFEPHHVITLKVRTRPMRFRERWIHPTLRVLAYGSVFGALIGFMVGVWTQWRSRAVR